MNVDEWVGYGLPEHTMDQAVAWLVKLESGEMEESEYRQFSQWLDSQPEHRWAFEELSAVWAKTSTLKEDKSLPGEQIPNQSLSQQSASSRGYFGIAIALMSIGLIIGLLG
ncbi:FecR/PupR family sigma factor regulator [Neptunicella marina]|uniref:FecR/PupR family sigma factor regulator n=1 Tax=Neptunicella marina TaxID=2125989 RepID=A0A8J6M1L1_9ALTE|nr:FecR family protein [Neptunicella marina]MBC3765578.1 FecR/PupR family sigma factor regulator [Neptunicella marina]